MKRMSVPFIRNCAVLLAVGGTLLAAAPARAALGAAESGIVADQNALHATRSVRAADNYAMHTLSTDYGLTVREYVDGAGKVFAVAWEGPARPDLQQLLGAYYAEYGAALLKIRSLGLRRSLRIDSDSMHVEVAGHMRAYVGRAYLLAAIPAGVDRDQLR